jgi:hypothetical protein
LTETASRAIRAPYAAAESWLRQQGEAPLDEWFIVDHVDAIHIPVPRLTVGRSTFYLRPPQKLRRTHRAQMLSAGGFHPPYVATTVIARDPGAAHVIASEHFAESGAILDLIDRREPGGEQFYALRRDGRGTLSFSRGGWILDATTVTPTARLIPPFQQLSRAAGKDEDVRSDWERRALAASRWFSSSLRSPWPADRLVSLMVALESLFVEGKNERRKGQVIAKRLTERFRRRGMTSTEQEAWLSDLYQRRNEAAHEGRAYQADLEVELLADLTHVAIRWAAHHLVPAHRPSRRSCRSFEAVMRCSS